MTKPTALAAVLLAALAAVWAIGRSTSVQSERNTIAEQAQRNAQVAHKAYRETRKLVAPALERTDRVQNVARIRGDAVDVSSIGLIRTIDSARAVLADSAAELATVRETLAATVASADGLIADVAAYRTAVHSLTVVHAAERRVLLAALTSADVALDAQVRATEAFKRAGRCRIIGLIPCPTRTQTAVGTALVVVAVFVAVR